MKRRCKTCEHEIKDSKTCENGYDQYVEIGRGSKNPLFHNCEVKYKKK